MSVSPGGVPLPVAAYNVFLSNRSLIEEDTPRPQPGAKYHPSISGQSPSPINVQLMEYLSINLLIKSDAAPSAHFFIFLKANIDRTPPPSVINRRMKKSNIPKKILIIPAMIRLVNATILMNNFTNMQRTVNMNGSLILRLL